MVRTWLLPLILVGGLAACDSGGVNAGVVNTSASTAAVPPQNTSGGAAVGATGRVVSINEVALRGAGGNMRGPNQGTMTGGMIGAAGGGILGAAISGTVGGSLIGLVLGTVGGAIAGTIADSHGGNVGPGIAVTVQTDDGQNVTVAQRDDGDVQLGDRVQIIQDRRGVAKVVRDNSRTFDPSQQQQPQPGYGSAQNNYPPPDYRGGQGGYQGNPQGSYRSANYPSGNYPPQGNSQSGNYQSGNYPSRDYSGGSYARQQGSPAPQDDPRYGTLN